MKRAAHRFLGSAICVLVSLPAVAQTTRPAERAAAARTRVLVAPFDAVSASEEGAIGRAVQRSLVVDLSRARGLEVVEAEKVAETNDAFLADAKSRDASFAVTGTVQIVEGRLRITGDVLDVARGEPTGQFKITGQLRELFEMQDRVSEHVLQRVRKPAQDREPESRDDNNDDREKAEVPRGTGLRVGPERRDRDDYDDDRPDPITRRYHYGYEPYWAVPYGYGYHGYGYYRSPYHRYLRRPHYYSRIYDYSYTGVPDHCHYGYYGGYVARHPLRSYATPVPVRWLRDW